MNKTKLLEIAQALNVGTIDDEKARTLLLNLLGVSDSISSMRKTMDSFFREIKEEIEAEPNNLTLISVKLAYRIAMDQFHNRFNKYYS